MLLIASRMATLRQCVTALLVRSAIGQRAVLLEGVKERGVRTGQSEYTAITMKSVDEFGEGEAGGVVDVVD